MDVKSCLTPIEPTENVQETTRNSIYPGIGRLVTTNTVDSRAREFLLLKDRVTVGSDEASDFIIRDETISRRHAILTFQAGRLEVKDLGSTNGTFLNGKRIIGISAFDKGDRIRFGTVILFSCEMHHQHRLDK